MGAPRLDRKMLSDVEVAAYNLIFVMPKLSELLVRETGKADFVVSDTRGRERQISSLLVFMAEKEWSLTDPNILIALIRSMDKLYKGLAILHGEKTVGSCHRLDRLRQCQILRFLWRERHYGGNRHTACLRLGLGQVLPRGQLALPDRTRNGSYRLCSAGQEGPGIIDEEEAQRVTRLVAKSIEMLFSCGAYTEAMDAARETRASRILSPGGRMLEIKEKAAEIEVRFDAASPEHPVLAPGAFNRRSGRGDFRYLEQHERRV